MYYTHIAVFRSSKSSTLNYISLRFFHTTVGSYNNNLVTLNLLNHREYRNRHADVENNSAHFNIDDVSLFSSKLT